MRPRTVLYLAAVLLTGCTTAVDQTPGPGPPVLPTRPRELPLTNLEPCSLLTGAQMVALGVSPGNPSVAPDGSGELLCQWARFPAEPQDFYLASIDEDRGADYAVRSETGFRVVDIDGFPAVESQRADLPPDRHCFLVLDVASGQNLTLLYEYDGSTVPMTRELACEKAAVAAEMVIDTLGDLVGG